MVDLEAVLDRALALGEEGRWEEMAKQLSAALQEEGEDEPYLLCWLGVAERELGNDGAAYEYFRRCLARDPLDPHVLALAGSGLAAFDDPDAERALRTAVLTGPDLPITRLQYGAYLAREGLFDDALEHLQAAVSLAPDDPIPRGELGIALALKGDMAGAADAMEETLSLAPDDSWTRLLLGLVFLEQDRDEEAAEALWQAAGERPEDGEAQVLAALAAASVGWQDAAYDALARAEYATESPDPQLVEEAQDRLDSGADSARALLRDTAGPAILHERLSQPL